MSSSSTSMLSVAEYKRAALSLRRDAYGRYKVMPLMAFGLCLGVIALQRYAEDDDFSVDGHRRKLGSDGNYPPGTCDTYVYTNYKYAVIALLCWAIYYMFWGLAIVCDDYFVTSLEEICDALGLRPTSRARPSRRRAPPRPSHVSMGVCGEVGCWRRYHRRIGRLQPVLHHRRHRGLHARCPKDRLEADHP